MTRQDRIGRRGLIIPRMRALLVTSLALVSSASPVLLVAGDRAQDGDELPLCADLTPIGDRDVVLRGYDGSGEEVSSAMIVSRFDHADQMRVGNTLGELRLSSWETYVNRRLWYVRGERANTLKLVHLEVRGSSGPSTVMTLPVERCRGVTGGQTFPPIEVPDRRSANELLRQDFDVWHERWTTYQDALGRGNVFFPLTQEPDGGVDDGGYVWTDSSRWSIDAAETPDSILVALLYWRWLFTDEWRAARPSGDEIDLRSVELDVYLRARNLELGEAEITFWVLCDGARWHLRQPSLKISEVEWTRNRIVLPEEADSWSLSWSRGGESREFCLHRVESLGFALRGFPRGQEVRGVFELDQLRLRWVEQAG